MERFWNKVKKGEADECWPWQANIGPHGYGQFALTHTKPVRAHRMAYMLANGDIPAGLVIRHTCDNKRCCNPAHLLVGTQQDNIDDKVARDRQAKGMGHGCSKLTDDEVRAIRASEGRYVDIGKRFGIGRTMVGYIKRRLYWTHVK